MLRVLAQYRSEGRWAPKSGTAPGGGTVAGVWIGREL
jgi:hypothetical protein